MAQQLDVASMDVDQPQHKKRLMIREMVLENFKSYAGAQHVGPFHKVWPQLCWGFKELHTSCRCYCSRHTQTL